METTLEVPVLLMSFIEYSEAFKVPERTLKRRLAAGDIDGAHKDERGRWLIPVTPERARAAVAKPIPPALPVTAGPGFDYDNLPTLLTLEQAALVLAPATKAGIGLNPEVFGVIEVIIEGSGGHKRKMIPLATVKRLRGLIP